MFEFDLALNKIKDHKAFYHLIGCLACCLTCFMVSGGVSSDVYFMINSAETMLTEGFQYADSLSMFQNMPFYSQKWAMCFLTWFVHNLGGMPALMIGMYVLGGIRSILLFETMNVINPKSKTRNLFLSVFACLILNVYSLDFRPSVIADCFLFGEIIVFETHKRNKLTKGNLMYLWMWSAIISVGVMWFHSTMWPMCIIFALPYLCDNHKLNKLFKTCGFERLQASYSKSWPFLMSISIMVLCGLLNPHGLKQFWYMLCVILSSNSLSVAQECRQIIFGSGWSIMILLSLICAGISAAQTKRVHLRFVYFLMGTLIMTFTAQRCLEYFIPAVFFFIASCMIDADDGLFKRLAESFEVYIAVIICVAFVGALDLSYNAQAYASGEIDETLGYTVDNIIHESGVQKDAKIYCSFDLGSYLEYLGYKPYIDGRLEAFSWMINGQYDVLEEYTTTYDGSVPHLEYLDETYDFDYYVILNSSGFAKSLPYTGANLLYQDSYYSIYSYDADSL